MTLTSLQKLFISIKAKFFLFLPCSKLKFDLSCQKRITLFQILHVLINTLKSNRKLKEAFRNESFVFEGISHFNEVQSTTLKYFCLLSTLFTSILVLHLLLSFSQNQSDKNVLLIIPCPMCLLVFSIVEFRLTLDSCPKQNRLLSCIEGLVKPST